MKSNLSIQKPLWSSDGPITLKKVLIRAKVVGLIVDIQIQSVYSNTDDVPVSSLFKFAFPSNLGTVYGFEVKNDSKLVTGELEDLNTIKNTLFSSKAEEKEFLENSYEGEIFGCVVDNLEPTKELTVTFKYVTEISYDGGTLRLALPTDLTPLESDIGEEEDEGEEQEAPYHLEAHIDVTTPFDITDVESPTHPIDNFDVDGNKATVNILERRALLRGDLVLCFTLVQSLKSSFFIQQDLENQSAALFSVCPVYFSAEKTKACEVVFLVDCSATMCGSHIQYARTAVQHLLTKLPSEAFFNVISFSGSYNKLFNKNEPANGANIAEALTFIKKLTAELSSKKDLLRPLLEAYSSNLTLHLPCRKIFIFTDGQVDNQKQVLAAIRKHTPETRIFALGIGNRAIHSSVHELAKAGAGFSEIISGDEDLESKLQRLYRCSSQPRLELQLELKGTNFVHQLPQKKLRVEAYHNIPFSVSGFLPSFTNGELIVKTSSGFPITSLSFKEEDTLRNENNDKTLHRLVSKFVMNELGSSEQEDVMKLSKSYNMSSRYVSFFKQEENTMVFSLFIPSEYDAAANQQAPTKEGKKVYDVDFMKRYQSLCREPPEGLPQMEIFVGFQRNQKGRGNKNRNNRGGGQKKNQPQVILPQQQVAPLANTTNSWKRTLGKGEEQKNEEIFRKVQGILNKITLEMFGPLSRKLMAVEMTNVDIMKGVIKRLLDKAVAEQKYGTMYAELCLEMSKATPAFYVNGKKETFRCILLNSCHDEFERKVGVEKKEDMPDADYEELLFKLRKRSLGNVRFIGELYKLCMLTDIIIQECIEFLIGQHPDEYCHEALAQLLTTVGKSLDDKKRSAVDEYFEKIQVFSLDRSLPSRTRFMFKDLIDLRKNNWVPRRKENDPKLISEVHKEAEIEDAMNEAASRQVVARRPPDNANLKKSRSFSNELPPPAPKPIAKSPRPNENPIPEPAKVTKKPEPSPRLASVTNGEASQKSAASSDGKAKDPEPKKQDAPPPRKLSPEQLEEKIDEIMEEYFTSQEIEEAALCVRELQSPSNSEVVTRGMLLSMEKKETHVDHMIKLFEFMQKDGLLKEGDYVQGFEKVLRDIEDIEIDIPHCFHYVNKFIAHAITSGAVNASFLNTAFSNLSGQTKSRDMVLEVLSLVFDKDLSAFQDKFKTNSEFDILKFLPEGNRDQSHLAEILTEKYPKLLPMFNS